MSSSSLDPLAYDSDENTGCGSPRRPRSQNISPRKPLRAAAGNAQVRDFYLAASPKTASEAHPWQIRMTLQAQQGISLSPIRNGEQCMTRTIPLKDSDGLKPKRRGSPGRRRMSQSLDCWAPTPPKTKRPARPRSRSKSRNRRLEITPRTLSQSRALLTETESVADTILESEGFSMVSVESLSSAKMLGAVSPYQETSPFQGPGSASPRDASAIAERSGSGSVHDTMSMKSLSPRSRCSDSESPPRSARANDSRSVHSTVLVEDQPVHSQISGSASPESLAPVNEHDGSGSVHSMMSAESLSPSPVGGKASPRTSVCASSGSTFDPSMMPAKSPSPRCDDPSKGSARISARRSNGSDSNGSEPRHRSDRYITPLIEDVHPLTPETPHQLVAERRTQSPELESAKAAGKVLQGLPDSPVSLCDGKSAQLASPLSIRRLEVSSSMMNESAQDNAATLDGCNASSIFDRTLCARQAEWQRERELVSKQIRDANASQVIVLDDSGLETESSTNRSLDTPLRQEVNRTTQNNSPGRDDGRLASSRSKSSSFPLVQIVADETSTRSHQDVGFARPAGGKQCKEKPSRSQLPSGWLGTSPDPKAIDGVSTNFDGLSVSCIDPELMSLPEPKTGWFSRVTSIWSKSVPVKLPPATESDILASSVAEPLPITGKWTVAHTRALEPLVNAATFYTSTLFEPRPGSNALLLVGQQIEGPGGWGRCFTNADAGVLDAFLTLLRRRAVVPVVNNQTAMIGTTEIARQMIKIWVMMVLQGEVKPQDWQGVKFGCARNGRRWHEREVVWKSNRSLYFEEKRKEFVRQGLPSWQDSGLTGPFTI